MVRQLAWQLMQDAGSKCRPRSHRAPFYLAYLEKARENNRVHVHTNAGGPRFLSVALAFVIICFQSYQKTSRSSQLLFAHAADAPHWRVRGQIADIRDGPDPVFTQNPPDLVNRGPYAYDAGGANKARVSSKEKTQSRKLKRRAKSKARAKASKEDTSVFSSKSDKVDPSCSPDEFIDFMSQVESALKDSDLPTKELAHFVTFLLDGNASSSEWNQHLLRKSPPAKECSSSQPLEIVMISESTWCMNYQSTIADRSPGAGHGLMERRELQEADTQVTGSTCMIPAGWFDDSCASLTVSTAPDLDGICNLAVVCKNGDDTKYNVWNTGTWASDVAPTLYTNADGCVEGFGTSWSRTYCGQYPCQMPRNYPSGCEPKLFTLFADDVCSLMVMCADSVGSTYRNQVVYLRDHVPATLDALTPSTACIASNLPEDDSAAWVTVSCKIGCTVPQGTWAEARACGNVQITPWPVNGMCSLSTVCGFKDDDENIQYLVSNRGSYSPIGTPPPLSLNTNFCIEGEGEDSNKWAREFCTNSENGSTCPAPEGKYLESCSNRHYTGPDILGNCIMMMGCDNEDTVAQNIVAYSSTDNMSLIPFSTDESGCLTAPAPTGYDTFWTRAFCSSDEDVSQNVEVFRIYLSALLCGDCHKGHVNYNVFLNNYVAAGNRLPTYGGLLGLGEETSTLPVELLAAAEKDVSTSFCKSRGICVPGRRELEQVDIEGNQPRRLLGCSLEEEIERVEMEEREMAVNRKNMMLDIQEAEAQMLFPRWGLHEKLASFVVGGGGVLTGLGIAIWGMVEDEA